MHTLPLAVLLGISACSVAQVQKQPPAAGTVRLPMAVRKQFHVRDSMEIRTWQPHTNTVVINHPWFIPYYLLIEEIDPPDPVPTQQIGVKFHLINRSQKTLSGRVLGDIDGFSLNSTAAAFINNLGPGQEVVGFLTNYGIKTGLHTAHVTFADGVSSHAPAQTFNPFNPRPVFTDPAKPFLAEDSREFYVGVLEPIFSSSDLPQPGTPAWPVCGDQTEGFGASIKVLREWASVLPDKNVITPAVGTVISSHIATADFPFAHPFGFDANFYLAPDAGWGSLLAQGNIITPDACAAKTVDEDYCVIAEEARAANLPFGGILGVETDSAFLPPDYRPNTSLERAVVHGSWVIDCGHPDRHAEIHPPLLTAFAAENTNTGLLRATFIARPYGVRQEYTEDGLPFILHALGQVAKVEADPVPIPIDAFPIIDPMPFHGTVIARYTMFLQPVPGIPSEESTVKFHFVKRPGVSVVMNHTDKYHLYISVIMDESQYVPLPPPDCPTTTFTLEKVDSLLDQSAGTLRKILNGVPAAAPLIDFLGSLFGIPPGTIEIAEAKLAVSLDLGIRKLSCSLPLPPTPPQKFFVPENDNQVVEDPNQPYPLVGWVMMRWNNDHLVQLSPEALRLYHDAGIVQVHVVKQMEKKKAKRHQDSNHR